MVPFPLQVLSVWDELESRDYGWRGLPRYALGVSSGGAMALVLAQVFPLQVGSDAPSYGVLHIAVHHRLALTIGSWLQHCVHQEGLLHALALCICCSSLLMRSSLSTGLCLSWMRSCRLPV